MSAIKRAPRPWSLPRRTNVIARELTERASHRTEVRRSTYLMGGLTIMCVGIATACQSTPHRGPASAETEPRAVTFGLVYGGGQPSGEYAASRQACIERWDGKIESALASYPAAAMVISVAGNDEAVRRLGDCLRDLPATKVKELESEPQTGNDSMGESPSPSGRLPQ
jgi:hypothetical protein